MGEARDAQGRGPGGRLPLRIAAFLASTYVAAFPMRQIARAWRDAGDVPPASLLATLGIGCVLVVAGLALAVSPRSRRVDLAISIATLLAYALLAPTRWGGM